MPKALWCMLSFDQHGDPKFVTLTTVHPCVVEDGPEPVPPWLVRAEGGGSTSLGSLPKFCFSLWIYRTMKVV